jgi:hypothetical protein
MKLRAGLPSLRGQVERSVIMGALHACKERRGFRLVHYSIQGDHLHLLAEAEGPEALGRAIQGLAVSLVRALNGLWRRRGAIFADRYHSRVLRTPREVRGVLAYVLCNGRKHGRGGQPIELGCSGWWFDGWRDFVPPVLADMPVPVAEARSWLLRIGWRRHGLIGRDEVPGGVK